MQLTNGTVLREEVNKSSISITLIDDNVLLNNLYDLRIEFTDNIYIYTHCLTSSPTESPTNAPTFSPSNAPTYSPTQSPTDVPTFSPSNAPTYSPTNAPSYSPTDVPTDSPSPVFICVFVCV